MTVGGPAVVIGAGLGGLCAARVLADLYERITVIDWDTLPPDGSARPGVPQGRHLHALLAGGAMAIDDLFPGVISELVAAGASSGDVLADGRCYFDRCRLVQVPSGLPGIGVTRPYLEHRIRQRLTEQANVTMVSPRAVAGLTATPDGAAVSGVRLAPQVPGDREDVLAADLVVDASGRRSRTPQWLAELGYPQPVEERIRVDVAYASCLATMPSPTLDGDSGIVVGGTVDTPRGGGIIAVENGRWLVSLAGYRDAHPPVTPDGFVAFARTLPMPDIYDALRTATSIGTPVRFHIPDVVRRHYQRLSRFPDRLVVLGDAVASFNPVYGQGMSVAAAEALILRDRLRQRSGAVRDIRAEIANAGAVAWRMSVNSDLRMPWIDGRRSLPVRVGNRYAAWLYRASRHDPVVARAFIRVANLVEPPTRLARPSIVLRVLGGGLRGQAAARSPTVRGSAPPDKPPWATTAEQDASDRRES